jgi:predicted N-formylglutamate amidohydrolase
MKGRAFLFTCEHAGNVVPPAWRGLFLKAGSVLESHRGWDPGMLVIARACARAFGVPLLFSRVTRLLVDLNRSPSSPTLLSEFTRGLAPDERQVILDRYYHPHRRHVDEAVDGLVARFGTVTHIAFHSFTPVLHGETRRADIGILYDPTRPREKAFARRWAAALRELDPGLRVRMNYPYLGSSDCVAFALRKRLGDRRYAGLELEVNQRFFQTPEGRARRIGRIVQRSLEAVV